MGGEKDRIEIQGFGTMESNDSRESVLEALGELHQEIDREADRLADRHGARLNCARGCSACCLDDLRVTAVEAERIRSRHADLLTRESAHSRGACAFLDDEGACRIYADRPSMCRSQGLPLRVLFEDDDGEIAERRDICPRIKKAVPRWSSSPKTIAG